MIQQMTEQQLIEQLTRDIVLQQPSSIKGVGDDAAVIAHNAQHTLVASNMLLEGVHFDLTYTPLKHLGYKAAVVNFSDIAAMNGLPRQLLVSMGVSAKMTVDKIEEIYSGIRLACEHYNVDIVGGDTSTSLTGLTLSLTAIGVCAPEQITYRTGAQPTDLLCLTGSLGAAYMGLLLLEREKKVFEAGGKQPQLQGYDYVIEKYLKPKARVDIVESLHEEGLVPSAMIDISKGLAADTLLLCEQSKVGARLYIDRIPIAHDTNAAAQEMNLNPMTAVLNGGEDYELLFTLPVALHDKIKNLGKVDIIGHIVAAEQGCCLVSQTGEDIPLTTISTTA
ncbi:thiamine-monophosphate kinase [Bacteroidia bacterium]|nr:thiamine-monophosphate kinase [Bacteroidia bacterium]